MALDGGQTGGPRRRSCLSVPAGSERKLEKALGLEADEIVIDLEDAVAIEAKDEARAAMVTALRRSPWEAREVAVRVNAPRTPWCHLDLIAVASLPRPPRSVVVPKVEEAGDLAFVERLLDGVDPERRIGVQALVETARGLAGLGPAILSCERLEALILGYADLAASLGRPAVSAGAPDSWHFAQETLVAAARAAGVQAIDGPFLGIERDDAFARAVAVAAGRGFDGKWAIHPSHLADLNDAFTPTGEQVTWARSVVATLEVPGEEGALRHQGEMVDEAVARLARTTLVRAGLCS